MFCGRQLYPFVAGAGAVPSLFAAVALAVDTAPTPSPAVTPVPTPAVAPVAVPANKAPVKPAPQLPPTSPFLTWPAVALFSEGNRVESLWPKANRVEMTSLDFGEQTLMPPANSGTLSGSDWYFQKRFSPFGSYMLMRKSADEKELTSVNSMRGNNLIVDAVAVCPLSRQALLLGYGIDASGKALVNGKPRRLYLVDLESGNSSLVWRMNKDDRGGIAQAPSATPDCKHIVINLKLETEGQRAPYGKVIYLKGEADKFGVFPETVAQEIKPGGGSKNFASAVLAAPPSAEAYVPQQKPPKIVLVREYIETVAQRYRIDVLTPNTKGTSWSRQSTEVPAYVKRLHAPMFYNRIDSFAVLFEKAASDTGVGETGIASLPLGETSGAWHESLLGGAVRLMWAGLHPSGDRLVASYVLSDKAPEKWAKPMPPAGVVEMLTGTTGKPSTFAVVESMLPFHALAPHHNPRPQYAGDGKRLFYTMPAITDLADAKLFEPTAQVDESFQFHTSLVELKM
jgi:hypothetical protein